MKDILKTVNKKSIILSTLYKNIINICWFSFGIIMLLFLNDVFNKERFVILILSLFIIYVIKTIFDHFYKKEVEKGFYSLKHSSEMYYFRKLEKLDPSSLEHIDKEYLGNKILEISYNLNKIVSDLFEYCLPFVIGMVIYMVVLTQINIFLPIITFVLILSLLFYEYKKYEDEEATNYNDLLKDFVFKLTDIRMLNCFSFCAKKLDKSDNNICILRNKIKYDLVYDIASMIILLVAIIPSIFILKNVVDILGVLSFFTLMAIGLKDLMYSIVPTIKNIKRYKRNKIILEEYLSNTIQEKHINEWKKINIKGANFIYESGVEIKIPNFEFNKGENISILGAAGMGKSTLLHILSGMYRLNEGFTYVNDKQTNASIDSMYITRSTKMFKISLRDNLLLDNKMSDEDLLKLLKEIDVMEWYEGLNDGLDTIIDINYINLPDQVREKLNILRGVISDKETLLLDEPTYDLDIESEKIIANMIKKYWKKKSYIIVTHRPIFTTICKKHYFMKNHQLLESEPLL